MATKTPKVIISLTSHSIRLKQVAKTTIWSIIQNTYANKHIVLTLFKDDVKLIPADLRLLIDKGLVELIVADKDLGPHLKYFYAMQKYRECPVITVDDDVLYPPEMITEMVEQFVKFGCIVARRCFGMVGMDYKTWMKRGYKTSSTPTMSLFPTGIGGILYPPDCLALSEDNIAEILSIKYDDDFYLKALEIRKNLSCVCFVLDDSKRYKKNLSDEHTQSIALWRKNTNRANNGIKLFHQEFSKCVN